MIGIIMATMLEANPLCEAMQLAPLEEKPFRVFGRGKYLLIISGIGKVNAALATGYLAQKFGVRVFLNAGAAGALNDECAFGNVYHIREAVEPDVLAVLTKRMRNTIADVLDGFPTALLATRDIPAVSKEERSKLAAFADIIDMEGAAVIQAARKFDSRCYLFKIVSDTSEHSDDRAIVENIKMLGRDLSSFIIERILKALPESDEKIAVDDPGQR